MHNRINMDTTMGITALDDLPIMGIRCETIAPGATIYIICELNLSPDNERFIINQDYLDYYRLDTRCLSFAS
ncbi:Uncharacterised protein [Legionella pneumophila]|nr:Uncharacterised protein [Legionella pneumophila]